MNRTARMECIWKKVQESIKQHPKKPKLNYQEYCRDCSGCNKNCDSYVPSKFLKTN